jgi:hypothetical protein
MSYEVPFISIQTARQLRAEQVHDAEEYRLARLARVERSKRRPRRVFGRLTTMRQRPA